MYIYKNFSMWSEFGDMLRKELLFCLFRGIDIFSQFIYF